MVSDEIIAIIAKAVMGNFQPFPEVNGEDYVFQLLKWPRGWHLINSLLLELAKTCQPLRGVMSSLGLAEVGLLVPCFPPVFT